MTITLPELRQLEEDGFQSLPHVFSASQVDAMISGLESALASNQNGAIRSEAGTLYAARNVLALWPEAARVWRVSPLDEILRATLGHELGLVRALFFDKPPGQSWALPWHKDLTVAVRDNRLPSPHFSKPTRKAGVPHVEAPHEVLEAMLTARIHLDEVTEENGPLKVIPGSHRTGKLLQLGVIQPRTLLAGRGDVLLIRPLVAHCSNPSQDHTRRHRRVLHLEFAAREKLPNGYAWHDFVR
jgi:hypothetical protein